MNGKSYSNLMKEMYDKVMFDRGIVPKMDVECFDTEEVTVTLTLPKLLANYLRHMEAQSPGVATGLLEEEFINSVLPPNDPELHKRVYKMLENIWSQDKKEKGYE